MTLPIERMNRLPEALATARCRARSPSAKPTESEASAPHPRHAPLQFGDVGLGATGSGERGGARLDGEPDLGKVVEKAPVYPGIEMPGQHVGIEHVPGAPLAHDGADPRFGGEQAFRNQGLDALTQDRARHAEHRREFGIARQADTFGVTADNDVDCRCCGPLQRGWSERAASG